MGTYTEAEAETKWCAPVVLAPDGSGGSFNPQDGTDFGASPARITCIASECMLWRWSFIDPNTSANNKGYCGFSQIVPTLEP